MKRELNTKTESNSGSQPFLPMPYLMTSKILIGLHVVMYKF